MVPAINRGGIRPSRKRSVLSLVLHIHLWSRRKGPGKTFRALSARLLAIHGPAWTFTTLRKGRLRSGVCAQAGLGVFVPRISTGWRAAPVQPPQWSLIYKVYICRFPVQQSISLVPRSASVGEYLLFPQWESGCLRSYCGMWSRYVHCARSGARRVGTCR